MSVTNLNILTDGTSGIYSHITAYLMREPDHISIMDQRINKRDGVFTEYIFSVSAPARKTQDIAKELKDIKGVVSVKRTLNLDDAMSRLSKTYPDIIGCLNEIGQTIDSDIHSAAFRVLGAKLGQKFVDLKPLGKSASCEKVLTKSITPMLAEFSICQTQGNRIIIDICPFCRGKQSEKGVCFFALGMIEGAIGSYSGLQTHSVVESRCVAMGHEACEFTVDAT